MSLIISGGRLLKNRLFIVQLFISISATVLLIIQVRSSYNALLAISLSGLPMFDYEYYLVRFKELTSPFESSYEASNTEKQAFTIPLDPSDRHVNKISPKPIFNVAQKIFYFSRHYGTTTDFQFMANALQLENVTCLNPKSYFEFFSDRNTYKSILDSGYVEQICSSYDAIFISDSLADGWAFIMNKNLKCKNLVFVITNRFDVGVRDSEKEHFAEDFAFAINRNDKYRAKVVVNNPFEVPYCKGKNVPIPEDHRLIRPLGNTDIPVIAAIVEHVACMILGTMRQDLDLMFALVRENTGIECTKFEMFYGGPRTLSQHNSIVVHLPYQVSIMKMWENLAHGVLYAIPSPRHYKEICETHRCEDGFFVRGAIDLLGENWSKYSDFYLPGWERCFIQFDSWSQLSDILVKKSYLENVNFCRNKMMDLRTQELQAWKSLLLELQS